LQVQFVGSVHNQATTATNVSYEIGDGTGYIDVRQWLDSADDEAGKMDGIQQDRYVSIIGTIKVFGGKRHISAQHIHAVEDHNEVFRHLLKALQVTLTYRNGGVTGVSQLLQYLGLELTQLLSDICPHDHYSLLDYACSVTGCPRI